MHDTCDAMRLHVLYVWRYALTCMIRVTPYAYMWQVWRLQARLPVIGVQKQDDDEHQQERDQQAEHNDHILFCCVKSKQNTTFIH